MRAIFTLALLVIPAALAADDKKSADELKALVGKWDVHKAELEGKDITEPLKVLKFEITAGGKYTAEHGAEKDAGVFTVDVTKSPKAMLINATGGPAKDTPVKAIYKLDGDTLTVCYRHGGGGNYPTAFETKPDTKLLLITYKRSK